MKKFLCLFVSLFVSAIMFADHVTEQQALQKAQQFMKGKNLSAASTKAFSRGGSKEADAFYIFNAENNGGFVIVSGDDRTTEILGYSDHGRIDLESAPSDLKWLLECYKHTIDSLALESNVKMRAKTRNGSSARSAISPLITTHWGQGAPYNNMCPEVDGQRCLTGCVATAMAQIINYHKWPQGDISAINAYTTRINGISMPSLNPTSFNWNNMTDDDVARLMLYCGQSVNTDYGIDESGAGNPEEVFKEMFKYSKSVQGWGGKKYSAEHLEALIYDELFNSRPVYFTGHNSTRGNHAFVVDGYNDGLFHINWGWNGDEDGYFVLTGLSEDVMPFPSDWATIFIVGIEPPAQNINDSKVITKGCWFSNRSAYRTSSSGNYLQQIHLSGNLYSDYDGDFYIGYGLYNDEGLVKVLSSEKNSFPLNESFHMYGYLGEGIPAGDYLIYQIYRHNESEEWMKCEGSNQNHIIAHVNEKSLIFEDPIDDNNGSYFEYGVYDIEGVTYQCFSEFGNNWAHVLPYQVSGKYAGDIVIPNKIEADGETFVVARDEYDAFKECGELLSITTSAEKGLSISNCPKLKYITAKQGNSMEIRYCHALETVVFPITMDYPSVSDCNNLQTITILNPALEFNSMGAVSWEDESLPCLKDVYFPSPVPPVVHEEGEIPVNTHATLHVPKGSKERYLDSPWGNWTIVDDQPAAPFVTWGYCHSDVVSSSGMSSGMGDNDAEYAMRVPAEEMRAYIGSQITHIQVYSPSRSVNDYGYENYEYVFITKPGTDYLVKQPFEVIRGAWNTVKLDEPYTITGETLYVGVGRHGKIGIKFADDTYVLDASWQRPMGHDNGDVEEVFIPGKWVLPCPVDQAHPLPLRFAIEGESTPEGVVIRDMKLIDTASSRGMEKTRSTNPGKKIQGTIRNRSMETITSYKVEWTIDGNEKGYQTFETEILPNACEFITIELPESVSEGYHEVTFDVTTTNNNVNELSGTYLPVFTIGTKPDPITVTAENYTIKYGDVLPKYAFTSEGGELTGTPEISCDATITSPVGTYPITIAKGSIVNEGVTYVNGTLTITKAPLTIKAGTYTRKRGKDNPEFTLSYQGFKNNETKDVLTKQPLVTTSATINSPIGTYAVIVSGAEASNYEVTHVNGTLIVERLMGDVDGDGELTDADVKSIVKRIMGNTLDDFDEDAADVDGNDKVNVADIVEIVKLMK